MTISTELAAWAGGLTLGDVPPRVTAAAQTQILSQLAAVRAGLRHPFGRRITAAFGAPAPADPRSSAYVLAALSVGLDFDDTAYAGHLSHSTVNVPLAYAAGARFSGADVLTAVVAANECAARVTAAATLGPFRGQSAAHTHLVGAVAGRLRLEGAPPLVWVSAWGLALALPLWPLDRGFYGSDAKLLIAAAPVRLGLDACDGALHGLRGAEDMLEHPDGFLTRFADVPLPDAATAGLGRRWHTETFSVKEHPGSAYLGAAVACAADLHHQLAGRDPDEIVEVLVEGSLLTALLERAGGPYVAGPGSPLSTLSFSLGYNTATALLTGSLRAEDLAAPALEEPARWRLAGKVRVAHDPAMTRRALAATAPLGEALRQAGPRAGDWLRERADAETARLAAGLGAPAETFEAGTKRLGARVTVRFADGTQLASAREAAPGSIGEGTAEDRRRLAREKFAGTGGPSWAADAVEKLEALSGRELADVLRAVLEA